MTAAEIKIAVISELTGDPKDKVKKVVDLMKSISPSLSHDAFNKQLSQSDADTLRNNLKNDDDLIPWYNEGLHYLS